MKRNRILKLVLGVAAAAAVAAGSIGLAGAASAEPNAKSTTYVDGFGVLTDDWSDHYDEVGALCSGCDNSQEKDLVLLWQSVLAVDGYLPLDDVIGYFGPKTAKATKEWQADRGLDDIGEVDEATWSKADDKLAWDEGDPGTMPIYGVDGESSIGFERSDDREGRYMLRYVDLASGESLTNSNEAHYIEMSKMTIELEFADDDDA